MTRYILTFWLATLALACACGGPMRSTPADEVPTRMNAADEAALDDDAERVAPDGAPDGPPDGSSDGSPEESGG